MEEKVGKPASKRRAEFLTSPAKVAPTLQEEIPIHFVAKEGTLQMVVFRLRQGGRRVGLFFTCAGATGGNLREC